MRSTITAPTTMGGTVDLAGDHVGSFLIHQNTCPTFIGDDIKFLWTVTHVASGMRFQFTFFQKRAARGFASDVEGLVEWSAVNVKMSEDKGNAKGEWVSGMPDKKQTAAIYAAAKARGALIP